MVENIRSKIGVQTDPNGYYNLVVKAHLFNPWWRDKKFKLVQEFRRVNSYKDSPLEGHHFDGVPIRIIPLIRGLTQKKGQQLLATFDEVDGTKLIDLLKSNHGGQLSEDAELLLNPANRDVANE